MIYVAGSPNNTAIRRMSEDDSLVWMAVIALDPSVKGLSIDPSEKSVYIASYSNPVNVARLQASNGSIDSGQTQ